MASGNGISQLTPGQRDVYDRVRGGAGLVMYFTNRVAGKTWLLARLVAETLDAGGRAAALFPTMAMSRGFLEELERNCSGLRQNKNQLGIYARGFLAALQCVRSRWDLLVMDEPWLLPAPPAIPFDVASKIVMAGTPKPFIDTEVDLALPDIIVWDESQSQIQ